MSDQFDQFVASHPVVQRLADMKRKLVGAIKRDETGDRDQAAITRRKPRALPDVGEQDLVGVVSEWGAKSPNALRAAVGSLVIKSSPTLGLGHGRVPEALNLPAVSACD